MYFTISFILYKREILTNPNFYLDLIQFLFEIFILIYMVDQVTKIRETLKKIHSICVY